MEKYIRGLFNLLRICIIKIKCRHEIAIHFIQPMRMSSELLIKKNAQKVKIGKNCKLEKQARIRVMDDGILEIGDNCFFNCNAFLTVMGKTVIGDNCRFGPNVLIFDHDHDFRAEGGVASGKMKIGEVVIGNNVWIGGNCQILKGSIIGDGAVIAAGTTIKGVIPPKTIVIPKVKNEVNQIIGNDDVD